MRYGIKKTYSNRRLKGTYRTKAAARAAAARYRARTSLKVSTFRIPKRRR